MNGQRIVKMMTDSSGRQILVEISNNIEVQDITLKAGKEFGIVEAVTSTPSGDLEITHNLSKLIADTTSYVLDGLETMIQPSKITIELGVEVGGEAGFWFITKATASSAIKVSLEYEFPLKK